MVHDEYSEAIEILRDSDLEKLQILCETIENFPYGKDAFIERHWITNAIDCGSFETVMWMLAKGVELRFEDDEGYAPLHSCLQRDLPNKYEIFEALVKNGADINAHGPNDYTPLHLAIAMNDFKALKILLEAGADKTIPTRIDEYETPTEMAYRLSNVAPRSFNIELYELIKS